MVEKSNNSGVSSGSSSAQSSSHSSASAAPKDAGLQGLTEGLTRDAGELAGGLKDLAGGVAGEAKKAAESQIDAQKGRLTEGIGGVAHALRQASGASARQLSPAVAPYAEKAADQLEKVSDYFEKKSLGDVARDAEDFARREPALFLGGAFVLGLLGGRFLKASAPAPSRQARGQQGHAHEPMHWSASTYDAAGLAGPARRAGSEGDGGTRDASLENMGSGIRARVKDETSGNQDRQGSSPATNRGSTSGGTGSSSTESSGSGASSVGGSTPGTDVSGVGASRIPSGSPGSGSAGTSTTAGKGGAQRPRSGKSEDGDSNGGAG